MGDTYKSLPRTYTFAPSNASLTGFASNVTGATWTLTATAAPDGLAHQVSIRNDSANDKSLIGITLVGTDANGSAQTEVVTGPVGSATVESAGYYKTLTSVTPASTWGADTADIGYVDEFVSQTINVNCLAEDSLTLVVDIGGTINFTVEQTFDRFDVEGSTVVWHTITDAGSQTADGIWNTTGGATAVRFVVNSYSNGATVRLNANATFWGGGAASGGGTSDVNLIEVGGAAIALGQTTMAASIPVTLASNQTGLAVTIADGADVAEGAVADAAATAGGTGTVSAKLRRISTQLPAAVGQTTMSASLPVTLASNQTAIPVTPTPAVFSTGTLSAVASSATAVTVLAANAARRSASVYYAGAAILYLSLGAGTPTSTSYTVQMGQGLYTYFEAPIGFTGIIQGIWSSAVGSANVTEGT